MRLRRKTENSRHVGVERITFEITKENGKQPPCWCIYNGSPLRLRRKTENSRHVGVQRDRSFYGDLHEMSDILIMLLMCIESDKIPSLHKFKKLYKRSVGFLIDIAYTADNITVQVVHQDGSLFLGYGIVIM